MIIYELSAKIKQVSAILNFKDETLSDNASLLAIKAI